MIQSFRHARFDSRKLHPREVLCSPEELLHECLGKEGNQAEATLRAGEAALGADDPAVARLRSAMTRLAAEEPDDKPDEWYDEEMDAENSLIDAIVAAGEEAVCSGCNALDRDVYEVAEELDS